VELDAGAHARQVSQQPWVIEVVALARLDGGMRGAVRDGALQRVELAQRRDQFLALQLALAGAPPAGTGLPPQALARHSALFRQRPVTAAAITAVITDYFGVPVTFQPFVGGWYLREDRLHLGAEHCTLGQGAMLGERCHRADLAAEIKIGPLRRARYEQFLPGAKGAQELTDILAMFGVVNVRYRVRLVLHAAEIEPCQLSASAGLGHGVFLHGRSGDSDDFCHDIVHPGTVRTAS